MTPKRASASTSRYRRGLGNACFAAASQRSRFSDHEREAALGRERQDRWRGRQIDSKSCGVVEWSGPILTMLIETGYIEDSDAGDSKTVARAIGEMLADAAEAKAWRKRW
jgi:hypothetical protein